LLSIDNPVVTKFASLAGVVDKLLHVHRVGDVDPHTKGYYNIWKLCYKQIMSRVDIICSTFSGVMWSIADISFFMANEVLDESVSFPIINAVSIIMIK